MTKSIQVGQPSIFYCFTMADTSITSPPTNLLSPLTAISIPPAIRSAFTTWLVSTDNSNRARLDDEKYLNYKSFLTFPKSTLPHDIKDREDKRRWSNQKHDALTNYELVNGQLYRRACKIFPQRSVSYSLVGSLVLTFV